jgi:hypothetical protein
MDIARRLAAIERRMSQTNDDPHCAACGYPGTVLQSVVRSDELGTPCESCERSRHCNGRPFAHWLRLLVLNLSESPARSTTEQNI